LTRSAGHNHDKQERILAELLMVLANTEASQAAGLFSHAWRYQIRLVDELFTSKLVRIFSSH
jgi:hypothetical protein